MTKAENPYLLFLGVETNPRNPDFGKVLGIDLAKTNADDIVAAIDQVIKKLESTQPGEHAKQLVWLIKQLKMAKQSLTGLKGTAAENKSPAPASRSKKDATNVKPNPSNPSKASSPASKDQTRKPLTAKKQAPAAETKENADRPSFELDAPDQNDSFDSDTQFSGNSLSTQSVTAPTIDPMSPVPDPTEDWNSFDIDQIDLFGRIETTKTITRPATHEARKQQTGHAIPVRQKTFYSETYRKKSKVGVMIGGISLAMLIIAGVIYITLSGSSSSNSEEVAQTDEDEKTTTSKKENASSQDSASGDAAKSGNGDQEDPEKSEPKTDSESTNDPGNEMKPGDNSKEDSDQPEEKAPNKPEPSDSNSPKKPAPVPDPPENPAPDTSPEKKSEPSKEPMKAADPKNSDIAELSRLLIEIRSKLAAEEFTDANRLLKKAQSLPALPDHQLVLKRLTTVSELYQNFWNKVVEGCGNLKALDEIKFSETNVVKIVESSEDLVVFRALGKTFRKEPRELQLGLAMKIAEKEMDMLSAEGRMIKGAVFAIESTNEPDRADEARSTWEEAKLVGAETDELILFLDDNYDDFLASSITRAKVPNEEDLESAQERFRTRYEDQLKTAARNAKNADTFVVQLLKDVTTLDEPADRHANFVAGIFYAGKSGNVELVMTTLSDFNKWFSIDLEQETLEALVKMNRNRLKPDEKREITRTAFEYMDRAKEASNSKLELQFAELALASAKGTRDGKLIQTATREVQRIKATLDEPGND